MPTTTVLIPRAGASPVTANLGPLQPVGPIADSPSVKAFRYIWTWTYSPNSESVSFRRVQSNSVSFKCATSFSPPVQQQDKSPMTAPSVTPSALNRFSHHSVPPYVPANFRWTFNPQNETVTFHRLPKPAPVPLKPPSRFPLSTVTADDPWIFKLPQTKPSASPPAALQTTLGCLEDKDVSLPDQLLASTLKDVKGAVACGALEYTNTRAVSLKEETKEPNQGGGSTGFRDPAKQAREKGWTIQLNESPRLASVERNQFENTDLSLKTRMT
eukprot:jgi/Psemu1/44558/gm1.44558_g